MTSDSLVGSADFREFLDRMEGVAIWVASGSMDLEYLSAGFEDIWGVSPEAVEADPDRLLAGVHPEDRERVRSVVEQSPEDVADETFEHRVVRPDGSVRWVLARLFAFREDGDAPTAVVGVSTDITAQKRRERELAVLNRVVRHDIRNDVSVILGWAELLEDHVDETGDDYLQKVLAAGENVLALTDSAREYVEVVTEDDGMPLRPVPVASVLKTELDLMRATFPGAAFRFVGDVPDVEVRANDMLSSAFRNLLHNAVQHSDRDHPVVEVTVTVTADAAVVRVADNGPGVPPDRREAVFREGERGEESAGTGIGLFLVRSLVTRYGGAVWVEDSDLGGATFAVRLPRVD